jgi:hypothetical protein
MPGRHKRETARYRYQVAPGRLGEVSDTARDAFLYGVILSTKTVQYASFDYASR